MYGNPAMQTRPPETTGQLIKYLVKKFPERLLKALPITILMGVITWLLHTYLLVVTNEGFNPDTWLGRNLLNTAGNEAGSFLFWMLAGSLIPMLISSVAHGVNPFRSIAEMVKMPVLIAKKNKATQHTLMPAVLFACSAVLLFDKLLTGVCGLLAGGMIMGSVVSFITGNGGVFVQVFRLAFTDIQTFVLKKRTFRLDGDSVYLIVGSSGVALLIYGIIQSLDVFNYLFGKMGDAAPALAGLANVLLIVFTFLFNSVWWILIILGVVLLIVNKTRKSVPKTLVLLAAAGLAIFAAQRMLGTTVYADDGGWIEAGGTFANWIASEGAVTAILRGLPPALASMLSTFFFWLFKDLFRGVGPFYLGGQPAYPQSPQNPPPVQFYQDPVQPIQSVQPQKPVMSEAERQRLERERLLQEQTAKKAAEAAEKVRLAELQKQKDIREKALAEKKKLEEQHERWLAEQDRLCKKYNTTPDKLMDVLRANNAANQDAAKRLNDTARNWELAYKAAVVTLAGCDAAIDGLATVTGPTGKWIQGTYKVVQGAAVGATEAALDGKSIEKGIIGGLVKGGANVVSDNISNKGGKFALTVISESVAGGVTGGVQGAIDGGVNGLYNASVGAITDAAGGKGFGDEVSKVSLAGGKTALSITTKSGKVVTKTVSDDVANKFIAKKVADQVFQSEVKAGGTVVSELGVKPVLQQHKILPK